MCEALESTRKRIQETQNKEHEDHIAAKGFISMRHYNLAHTLFHVAPRNEDSGCGGRSGHRVKGIEELAQRGKDQTSKANKR